jgi:hypothetical protein
VLLLVAGLEPATLACDVPGISSRLWFPQVSSSNPLNYTNTGCGWPLRISRNQSVLVEYKSCQNQPHLVLMAGYSRPAVAIILYGEAYIRQVPRPNRIERRLLCGPTGFAGCDPGASDCSDDLLRGPSRGVYSALAAAVLKRGIGSIGLLRSAAQCRELSISE